MAKHTRRGPRVKKGTKQPAENAVDEAHTEVTAPATSGSSNIADLRAPSPPAPSSNSLALAMRPKPAPAPRPNSLALAMRPKPAPVEVPGARRNKRSRDAIWRRFKKDIEVRISSMHPVGNLTANFTPSIFSGRNSDPRHLETRCWTV
jgi:hypothetical protein